MKLPQPAEFEVYFRDPIWLEAGWAICKENGIVANRVARSEQGENVVLMIDQRFVVKIYEPSRDRIGRELSALEFASGKSELPIPEIVALGRIESYDYLVSTQLHGEILTRAAWLTLEPREQVSILTQLAEGLRELHSSPPTTIEFGWDAFINHQINTTIQRQSAAGGNPLWIEELPRFLEENVPLLRDQRSEAFLHGDVHFGNLLFAGQSGTLKISGLFDFSDSLRGSNEYEFVAPGVLMIQGQCELQREFFRAYGYREDEIDETLRRRLMMLTILYECSDLRKYALRLRPEAVNLTIRELESAIWNFV